MDYIIQDSDIQLLKETGVSEDDIKHCMKVAEKALEVAKRTGVDVDMETIGRGALFHDLGKAITHEIEHGRIGALLGKKLGLPEKITGIMEKHIRGGLTEDEAKELGLPVKGYSLQTLEEKIVIYADRLVDIIMDGVVATGYESDAEANFVEILKQYPIYGKNEKTLNRYLSYHKEIQGLINRG
ncbi:MAG: HDIG domain-containing protein [Nitrospirae bacterium]|nr:HDIG domain-containing protein [Nitrospirota bacterium]